MSGVSTKAKILNSNSSDLDLSNDSITAIVNTRENKIDDAVLVANDEAGKAYIISLHIGDRITVKFTYMDITENWKQIFDGIVVSLEPSMDVSKGETCRAQLYAYPAIALNRMRATGQYSVDPFALQTLRQVLVTGQLSAEQLADFPFVEYFTEDADVATEWTAESTISKEDPCPDIAGSYSVKVKGPSGTFANYRFPADMASVHGFPLFLETLSNPRYNSTTSAWVNVPVLDLHMKRDAAHHNIEIQLRATPDDYVRFQLTSQDHGSTDVNLIPPDGSWVHLEIPIGTKWAKVPILVNGHSYVQDWMTNNVDIRGVDLRHFVGWDFLHSGNAGEKQNWNDVADISFLLTQILGSGGDTHFFIDGLKFVSLFNPLGIITNYVDKVFDVDDSGYAINTDCIETFDVGGQAVPYCKFVYEPITKCLQDISNLVAGYNWMLNHGVGIHWRMIGNKLCVAPVNDHSLRGKPLPLTDDATQSSNAFRVALTDSETLFVNEEIWLIDDLNNEYVTIHTVTAPDPSNPTMALVIVNQTLQHGYAQVRHARACFNIEQIWPLASKYTEQQPLKVSQDIISTNFKKAEPEANFIVINGVYQMPPSNEWMQDINVTNEWSTDYFQGTSVVGSGEYRGTWMFWVVGTTWPETYGNDRFAPTSKIVYGPKGIRAGVTGQIVGTTAHNFMHLALDHPIDLSLVKDPHITFWIDSANLNTVEIRVFTEVQGAVGAAHPWVFGGENGGQGDYFWKQFPDLVSYPGVSFGSGVDGSGHDARGWLRVDIPIGPDAAGWNITNHATWAKSIKGIQFKFVGGAYNGWVYIDALNVNGQIVKAAKSSVAIAVQKGVKAKLINEALASGYSVGTDIDALDRIAVYECLRDRLSPVTGFVIVPFDPDLMGGQQAWIQAPQFKVDTPAVAIGLDTDAVQGESVVHVANYTGLSVGQMVTVSDSLHSENKTIYSFTPEESGYYVHFSVPLLHNYTMVNGAQVYKAAFSTLVKLFRIQTVTFIYSASQGALTKLTVTDDLVNSYTKDPSDLVTQSIRAIAPDFQNRDYIRLKIGTMEWDAMIAKIIDVDA